MKLLKLIPAAAVALTAFTTFEAKSEQLCVYNGAADIIIPVVNTPSGTYANENGVKVSYKEGATTTAAQTTCIKLGSFVEVGETYDLFVRNLNKDTYASCVDNAVRSDSDSGKTKNFTVTGTMYAYKCK